MLNRYTKRTWFGFIFNRYQFKGMLVGTILMGLLTAVLAEVQGACERIRTTPIPLSYTLHLKRILFVYLLTLPLGFVPDLAWYSVPASMLVFFTLVGIESIGEEIEEPFGTDMNDLLFDNVVQEIEMDVAELLDDSMSMSAERLRKAAGLV